LDHVLWIGGPAGSGKTTVARRLARRHGLRWYNSDAHTWLHRDRALRAGNSAAQRFETLTPAEREQTSPAEMLAMSLHAERGAMTVDDLRALPDSPLIVAEGTQITPAVTAAGGHAVWLMLSAEGQQARLTRRHATDGVPPSYLELRRIIESEVRNAGARTVLVDDLTIEQSVAAVENVFAEQLATGPQATTPTERRELLRYANRAIVEQYLAWLGRWWTTGTPETIVRPFDCECGRADCTAQVELALADFPVVPDPVLAEGH
jgi:hypothetical protein